MEDVFHRFTRFGQNGTLFNKAGNDTFDESNLGVFEALESPSVELEAKNPIVPAEGNLIGDRPPVPAPSLKAAWDKGLTHIDRLRIRCSVGHPK